MKGTDPRVMEFLSKYDRNLSRRIISREGGDLILGNGVQVSREQTQEPRYVLFGLERSVLEDSLPVRFGAGVKGLNRDVPHTRSSEAVGLLEETGTG